MRISDWSSDVCSSDLSLHWLDKELAGHDFIVGDYFSIADITMFCTVSFSKFIGLEVPDDCTNVRNWFERIAVRPRAKRSEERRVGKGGVSTCRSRGSPYH